MDRIVDDGDGGTVSYLELWERAGALAGPGVGAGDVVAVSGDRRPGRLTVRVIARLAVTRAGVPLTAAEVGSRKARTLLAVLAVHPAMVLAVHPGILTTDRIAAALWCDDPPREPESNIATLVSRLRAALGPDVIEGGRTGYRLGAGVRVDLSLAAALTARAHPDNRIGLARARRALRVLDAGEVLPEYPEARWAEPARSRHAALLRQARHTVAEAALQLGDVRAAETAAQAAVAADGFDEAALRLLMRALHAAGDTARALLAYDRLRVTLATELGVDPDPATRAVHLAMLQDN